MKFIYTDRREPDNKEFSGLQSIVEKQGDRYKIYYAPWFFPEPTNTKDDDLLQKLNDFIEEQLKHSTYHVLLSPGQSIFIDNRRMLQGRNSISEQSKRHLVRLYIDSHEKM